jgi:hypothetical protein
LTSESVSAVVDGMAEWMCDVVGEMIGMSYRRQRMECVCGCE